MRIAFNPSTVAALTSPPNNKDITFDLRGQNIFARGVKFYGTDTNTWRDIKINNVSIGSHTLDLRNGSNTTLTNTNGVVTINSTWRPVVDNLTSNSATSSLSANQGRVLKSLIDGKSDSGHNHDDRYLKLTGGTILGALNFANGTWNLVGDDSYMGDCNIGGHIGIKAADTIYPGIAFFNNENVHIGNLTAYSDNIKYGANSLQFLDNGNTSVSSSTWTNPFSAYNSNAVADGQAICVWGQAAYLSNLSTDTGGMSLWLKRVNAGDATLNMVLDGEYYAYGNQRLAHVSEIPNKNSWNYDDRYLKLTGGTILGALNFANGTWNLVGDDSYMGDCNIGGHIGIKAADTIYPGIAFFNNENVHIGNLTAYSDNIKYGANSLQFLDNGNTSVSSSTWTNPFSAYNSNAVADGQAICVWGQAAYLSNLSTDTGGMSLWLKRVNAGDATLNMVLDGEYYAYGNQRLAHVSEIPNKNSWNYDDRYLKLTGGTLKGQIILPDIDVNTSYTGSIIIGASNTENLGIDGNEIMARNNGKASTLYLNNEGGAVQLGAILRTNSNIAYIGSQSTQDMIKFINNTNDSYGNGIAIGGGGLTIIGSGKSSDVVMSQHSSGGDKNMIIAGDVNIDFYSNLQDGWEYGKHMYLDTNGFLFTPSYINIGGNENNNSSPDRVWGSNGSDSYLRSYRTSALRVAYAENADTVDGYHASHLLVKRGRLGDYNIDHETTFGTRDIQPSSEITISGKKPFNGWGTLLVIGSIDGSSNHQLAFTGDNRMFIRCAYGTSNNYNTKDWATVALTSDNVASATKLQTARNIWGQSFDGTADVDNTLRIRKTTGNYCEGIRIQTGDGEWSTIILGATADSGTNTNAWSIHRKSDNNFAISRNSSDGANGLVMTPTGMGLGTTSPTQRLDVAGNIRTTGDIYAGGQIYSPSSVKAGNICLEHTDEINNITGGGVNLNYRNSGNVSLCVGGGNVGIGTMSPSSKLAVNGQVISNGFRHSSVNSNDYVLLAGGGYKSFGGDDSNPIFLGYLNLDHGNDGTISSSFSCLGYSVPFTYTRGGNYCRIYIPDTTHQVFYIRAATASVNYSGGGMDTWTGDHRGNGAWWLHCYAYGANEIRVKGFCQHDRSNDSWWGGNPLWSNNDGANKITVCIFGYVNFR